MTGAADVSEREEVQGESFDAGEQSNSLPESGASSPVFEHRREDIAGDLRTEPTRSESEERVAQSTDSTSRDIS